MTDVPPVSLREINGRMVLVEEDDESEDEFVTRVGGVAVEKKSGNVVFFPSFSDYADLHTYVRIDSGYYLICVCGKCNDPVKFIPD